MDYVPSYTAISFLLLVGVICTCAAKCITLRNKQNNAHEYENFPQMPPPPQYEINDSISTIHPPPYKLES